MGHSVFIARELDVCAAYEHNQTTEIAQALFFRLLSRSKWTQFQDYFQNTVSAAFAKNKSNEYIIAFTKHIRDLVVRYVNTGMGWLDEPSKKIAVDKIKQIKILAGAGVANIDDCTAFDTISCMDEQWEKTLTLIGQTVNPSKEWKMASSEVNAYYSPLHNHICIPYGIAMQPLYSSEYPLSWNNAGLGVIIAHELGHSIDAYDGVLFGPRGEYKPWLTQTASSNLATYVSCLSEEYEKSGMDADIARFSTDENMADQIAVHSIFPFTSDAYNTLLTPPTPEDLVLFAQTWCRVGGSLLRPSNTTDPHASAILRVNVTLEHLPAFQHAFLCPLTHHHC